MREMIESSHRVLREEVQSLKEELRDLIKEESNEMTRLHMSTHYDLVEQIFRLEVSILRHHIMNNGVIR